MYAESFQCLHILNIMYVCVLWLPWQHTPTVPPLFACVAFQVRDTKNAPPITPTQSFPPPPMLSGPPPPPGPMYPPPPPGVSSSTPAKRLAN